MTDQPDLKRWRGAKDLLRDAVNAGASAVERVHLATSRRPFAALEHIAPIAPTARLAHEIHDTIVAGSYGAVRGVTDVVAASLDVALDLIESGSEVADPAAAEPEASPARSSADRGARR